MRTQKNVLQRYKELFPQDTLRDVSYRTGIHHLRIFRLYQGYEMKLTEYEVFQQILLEYGNTESNFHNLFEQCLKELSVDSLEQLKQQMINLMTLKKFTHHKSVA